LLTVWPPVSWSLEPSVLTGVVVLAFLYAIGWRAARAPHRPHPPGFGRLALYFGGLLALLVALVSPVDALSDNLLVVHMVQHMLLLDIAPVLMILGLTKGILRPVTRRVHELERRAGVLAHPVFAIFAYVGLMYLWHIPAMYDLALRHSGIHALEHLCFFSAGSLYWWHLISPIRTRHRLGGLGPIAYMASTKLLIGALGILLAFDPHSLYPYYAGQPHWWGLTAIEDQNLAGLFMALEQSLVMGIALVWLIVRMLAESEREQQRRERFEIVS
jgi:putative membrane protein